MNTSPDLLRLIDALRPRDYRVTIVAPNGSVSFEDNFGTKEEADRCAKRERKDRDVAIVHCKNSAERN